MSDADLAGQVLMPTRTASAPTTVDKAAAAGNQTLAGVDTPAEMIAKFRLGGLILVGFTARRPDRRDQPGHQRGEPAAGPRGSPTACSRPPGSCPAARRC